MSEGREVHLSEDRNHQRPDYGIGENVSLSQRGRTIFRSLGYSDEEMDNMRGKVTNIDEHRGGFTVTVASIAGKPEVAQAVFYEKSIKLGPRNVKLGRKI